MALPQIGTVHMWHARPDELGGAVAAPDDEMVRAERFLRDDDRRRFLAARALTRGVLGGYLGCPPTEISLAVTAFGKPYLCRGGGPDLRFNLSHSGGVVALAVGIGAEVGIDVEAEPPGNTDELVSVGLSEPERRAYEELPPALRSAAFLRCWTRKEALLKASGTGLSCDPRMLTVGWHGAESQAVAMPASAGCFAFRDLALAGAASSSVALAAPEIAVMTLPWPAHAVAAERSRAGSRSTANLFRSTAA
ncbi:MAG: 4'-phosphopantetheinyl transferase superfamily protein [Bradyrhizobium sp.]